MSIEDVLVAPIGGDKCVGRLSGLVTDRSQLPAWPGDKSLRVGASLDAVPCVAEVAGELADGR